jgi:cytoskeletal protein CcmA (bactofilin family)/predicted RNA-binding Zn-ribbon protein involved in translation (DUF1610 family)
MADEPTSHRIELTCPECGHTQSEPALVVSTQCRGCLAGFQVRAGRAVTRIRPVTRLAKARQDGDPDPIPPPPPKPTYRLSKPEPPLRHPLLRWFTRPKPPREVPCFGCGLVVKVLAEAQSSQCPRCGGYISLQDYRIEEPWNRRIQTRGNVSILRNGSVAGAIIQCHHLTVFGELAATVECSGDLVIRTPGKIPGHVTCHHLRIERGIRVEFLHPVHAVDATIDGHVKGQILCSGTITLQKRARLHGLARAASLIVKPGAKHIGTLDPVHPAAAP